ncbi:MAG: 5'-methylthioadenosine/adenosylhomocysteine nucleosidase [Oscillospiraceae bacterium]|nr:5'-methylthioadenosine/adenosylhomocysteine nucleosidase [Oscillospiraceae bacterium]
MLIGIIGAMELEVQALKNLMDNAEVKKISSIEFYKGSINGMETVVAVAGVGKVNAAVCAQTMILKYSPDILINVGVAGGLHEDLKIGDIAVADAVVERDMDTTPIGDPKGFVSGIDMVEMECNKTISDTLALSAAKLEGISVKRGIIATGDQFISTEEQRNQIISEFGAIAAEMEGASIGHVCIMNGIPFSVLRAISDGANDDSVIDYPTFAKMAAENSIKIILEFLKNIKEEF